MERALRALQANSSVKLLSLRLMLSANNRLDVAANIKVTDYFNLPRLKKFDEVIENHVHDVFVKNTAVAVLIEIKLEALEFNAPIARNVFDVNCREVRKS